MDARTLKALRASIAKWLRNAVAKTPPDVWIGPDDCPLCYLFNRRPDGCDGCPVKKHSGQDWCDGTPYKTASRALTTWWADRTDDARAAFHVAARKMADYLIALLPEGETA